MPMISKKKNNNNEKVVHPMKARKNSDSICLEHRLRLSAVIITNCQFQEFVSREFKWNICVQSLLSQMSQ